MFFHPCWGATGTDLLDLFHVGADFAERLRHRRCTAAALRRRRRPRRGGRACFTFRHRAGGATSGGRPPRNVVLVLPGVGRAGVRRARRGGPAGFARHAAQVPFDFRFLVKASQLCTFPALREGGGPGAARPNPRFLDAAFARDTVVAPAVEGLGLRLGVLLFQFPPLPRSETRDPGRFAERLAGFLGALPQGPPYAIEIRNRELLQPAYAAALSAATAEDTRRLATSMPRSTGWRRPTRRVAPRSPRWSPGPSARARRGWSSSTTRRRGRRPSPSWSWRAPSPADGPAAHTASSAPLNSASRSRQCSMPTEMRTRSPPTP
jgi:hypothetical protein